MRTSRRKHQAHLQDPPSIKRQDAQKQVIRIQAQNDINNSFPLKRGSIAYGAVAGLLYKDAADIKQLLKKCRHHGLSIWILSECWQEGSMHAAGAGPQE
ncbi:g4851 [Coccomyxa elongata]